MPSAIVSEFWVFKKDFIYLFLERGEGEREGEKHQRVVASHTPHTGDLACNPGMCPDWESNRQPLGLQAHAQSTEQYQPGLNSVFISRLFYLTIKNGCNYVFEVVLSYVHI